MSNKRKSFEKRKMKFKEPRNWYAVDAFMRSSAGEMGDQRKEVSRKACRKFKRGQEDY